MTARRGRRSPGGRGEQSRVRPSFPVGNRDGRWNTGGVGWTDRPARRLSTAARMTLLAAVLAGLFGMHVLTADGDNGRHGALPMIGTASHDTMTDHHATPTTSPPMSMDALASVPGAAVLAVHPGPGGDGHGAMAGCILFLVVGGAALILLLLRYRARSGTAGLGRFVGIAVTDMRRRGPPGRWPRLSLCVIRV